MKTKTIQVLENIFVQGEFVGVGEVIELPEDEAKQIISIGRAKEVKPGDLVKPGDDE